MDKWATSSCCATLILALRAAAEQHVPRLAALGLRARLTRTTPKPYSLPCARRNSACRGLPSLVSVRG